MKQREIKFRAWILPHEDAQGFDVDGEMWNWDVFQALSPNQWRESLMVVMQFTGLQDKNGKDIYEGDVVEAKSWNPMRYTVEFIEGGFCFTHPNMKGSPIDVNMMYSSVGCACKVIGNIWENPELLPTNTTEG